MTATDDPTWDFRNPACKPRLLAVLRREANAMIEIATDPDCWHAPTACPGWEVRDMIGHLIDATEGYLGAFDSVRRDDCPTIIEFDPGTFILTGYNRVNAGTIHGEPKLAAMLRSSLIAI